MLSDCFHYFKRDVSKIELPNQFDYPHYYKPHELAILASLELQNELSSIEFCHNFGLDGTDSTMPIGKMFGVLVVKNNDEKIGYLRGFSGKIGESNWHQGFVPPIFDLLEQNSFFKKEENEINDLNHKIEEYENSERYLCLKNDFISTENLTQKSLFEFRQFLKTKKKEREKIRVDEKTKLRDSDYSLLIEKLKIESISQQLEYKRLSRDLNVKLEELKKELQNVEIEINNLKILRKKKSNELQNKIFEHYVFLNQKKVPKSLLSIFKETVFERPPAGAGECAAPKLLNFAFQHNLIPICMAEFWWGKSPESEIRVHRQYYSACKGKCEPILKHMLSESNISANPLLIQNDIDELEILYEDEWIISVNKPNDFLSVPGKILSDSILTRLKIKYPEATGPLLLHRLDMSTSGILLASKTKEVHQQIQNQFFKRSIMKKYIALLDGELSNHEGEINLPLIGDFTDRPKQKVCMNIGKKSKTIYKVIEKKNGKTLVEFIPITGRTHQLRVHSAHYLGLNCPIVGDDLYGSRNTRLFLHASELLFYHPVLKKNIHIKSSPSFDI
jgi:tRNA pseudouridine32 synthase/23S rRNA pseudouridine746 synthase